jgi:hypothetical protein
MLPEGVVVFDAANGRLKSATFRMNHELTDHLGEGSKYILQSDYREELLTNP